MWRFWLLCILLAGCGGNGASPVPAPHDNTAREVLVWRQPPTFADNTPMDIHRDVARWDIYCSPFLTFIDNDLVASVVTPDNLAFNLALLRAFGIEPGPDGKFIALKCIGIDNQASVFSEPTFWTE